MWIPVHGHASAGIMNHTRGGAGVRLVRIGFFLLVFFLSLYFGVLNSHSVLLRYYHGETEAPLALVMMVAILIGALFGVIASLGMVVKSKRELARMRKTMSLTEKELANLRSLPLKEKP